MENVLQNLSFSEITREFINNLINRLSNQEVHFENLHGIINFRGRNDLSSIEELCKDKTGVYIGKGGTGRSVRSRFDLKGRVSQEFRKFINNDSNTLSKNIQFIEHDSGDVSVERIRNFSLTIISVGDRQVVEGELNMRAINETEILEFALISIYSPKYNRRII